MTKKNDPFLDPKNPSRFISDEDPVWKKVKKEISEKKNPKNYYYKQNEKWQKLEEEKKEKTPFESYLAIIFIAIMFFGYILLYVYSSKQ
jgi:hypothetical protein